MNTAVVNPRIERFLDGEFAQSSVERLITFGLERERAIELLLGLFKAERLDQDDEPQDNSPFALVQNDTERQAIMSLLGIKKPLSKREVNALHLEDYVVYEAPKGLRRRYSKDSFLYEAVNHTIGDIWDGFRLWNVDQAVNWVLDCVQIGGSFERLASYSAAGCLTEDDEDLRHTTDLEKKFWAYFNIDYRRNNDPESYIHGYPLLW